MPKTPRLSSKKPIKLLRDHGFELDHVTGSHYIFYHPAKGTRVTVPFHTRDLPLGTIHAILKQADLM